MYFSSSIPDNASSEQLHDIYAALYRKAIDANGGSIANLDYSPGGRSLISYNLGFTDRVMVLCPRSSEGTKITGKGGDLIGPVALNGTLLGGTLLVKNEEEWDAIRDDKAKLEYILQKIGISPNAQPNEERL
jgi:sulfate adenylyltransferase (ADP) / ATP adenylyltransferase